jgi:xanthine/CO dehydrogenase XdhC/CoxF family maturation factor
VDPLLRGLERASLAAGADGEDLGQDREGGLGLRIGADTQAETALSILAEILAVRADREGGSLKTAKKRIHAEVD